jgi:hypothetical protein
VSVDEDFILCATAEFQEWGDLSHVFEFGA